MIEEFLPTTRGYAPQTRGRYSDTVFLIAQEVLKYDIRNHTKKA